MNLFFEIYFFMVFSVVVCCFVIILYILHIFKFGMSLLLVIFFFSFFSFQLFVLRFFLLHLCIQMHEITLQLHSFFSQKFRMDNKQTMNVPLCCPLYIEHTYIIIPKQYIILKKGRSTSTAKNKYTRSYTDTKTREKNCTKLHHGHPRIVKELNTYKYPPSITKKKQNKVNLHIFAVTFFILPIYYEMCT